jgi:pyruvate/2-oxoglutarate dehydrogenase complex dihydrolipoamide dehydrogenase (E3) component
LVAAAGAAGLGAKVALIERQRLGGDCLVHGCVPSKALLKSARVAASVRDASRFGVEVPHGVRVDFAKVTQRMRDLRASIAPHDSAERFRGLGVDVFFGEGRFVGSDTMEVGGQTLRFRRAVIATGSRPTIPAIPGLSESRFVTNETVFSLDELPKRLTVLGAGPIGCELSQAFARFGSQVTLITTGSTLLPKEDSIAASIVEAAMQRDGIEIVKNARLARVERGDAELRSDAETRLWIEPIVGCRSTDALLIAVGRTPNVVSLDLNKAGIEFDPHNGAIVNDNFRTSNPRVFAAGDVCSKFKFTHAADAMARIVLQNALFPGRGKGSSLVIPRCTYTDPEIAAVGLTEAEARELNIAVDVLTEQLLDNDRAVLDGDTDGFAKVLLKRGTDQIVGATIVAANAGEMLNELTLAMTAKIGFGTLAKTIHPYPTQVEVIKRLADQFQRRRLTPTAKRWLARWFAWTE